MLNNVALLFDYVTGSSGEKTACPECAGGSTKDAHSLTVNELIFILTCAVGHHTDSFNRELTLKSQCPKDRGVFDPGAHLHSQMHLHHVIFKKVHGCCTKRCEYVFECS